MTRFEVRSATPDMLPPWRELALQVEPLFEAAMADDEALLKKVLGSIRDGDVFAAADQATGEVAGRLIISRPKNEIACYSLRLSSRQIPLDTSTP